MSVPSTGSSDPPRVVPTGLAGLLVYEPRVFGDERGYFYESFNEDTFARLGLPTHFVQDNFSRSRRGVLRGLHFQNPRAQGKLVRCSLGRVWDVAVDVRPRSETFGKHFALELSDENRRALWIPPGFAHGFTVLSDVAHFEYKCTDRWSPPDEKGVRWDDPALGIAWPVSGEPTMSAKDRVYPTLAEAHARGDFEGL